MLEESIPETKFSSISMPIFRPPHGAKKVAARPFRVRGAPRGAIHSHAFPAPAASTSCLPTPEQARPTRFRAAPQLGLKKN